MVPAYNPKWIFRREDVEDDKVNSDDYLKKEVESVVRWESGWLEAAASLLDVAALSEDSLAGPGFNADRRLLLALVHVAQPEKPENESRIPRQIPAEQIDFARAVSRFAIGINYLSWMTPPFAMALLLGLTSEEDVVFAELEEEFPDFLIFINRQKKSIVLAIKSGLDKEDIWSKLICGVEAFHGGLAHSEALGLARKILLKSRGRLEQLLKRLPDFDLVVTGHSLGAGAAILITLELLFDREPLKFSSRIRCVALGPPPVFCPGKPLPETLTDKIEIYVAENDAIPSLSLFSIAKLQSAMKAVDELNLGQLNESPEVNLDYDEKAVLWSADKKVSLVGVQAAICEEASVNVPHLVHPGKLFFIKKADCSISLMTNNKLVFPERVVSSRTMFSDHNPEFYSPALGCNVVGDAQYLGEEIGFQFIIRISDRNFLIERGHGLVKRSVCEFITNSVSKFITDSVSGSIERFFQRLFPKVTNLAQLVADLFSRLSCTLKFENDWVDLVDHFLENQVSKKIEVLGSRLAQSGTCRIKESQSERLRQMCSFARNIYYAWFSEMGTAMMMGVYLEDLFIIPFEDDDNVWCPYFLIVVDHKTKSVVLVVRGTLSMKDIMVDLTATDKEFAAGSQAHAGILDGARKILRLTRAKLSELLKQHSNYDLVITGHSLGAGTAILITLDLLVPAADRLFDENRIYCFAFAPPPVFRSSNADAWLPNSILDRILIFVLEMDLVPSASLGSVDKLMRDLKEADLELSYGNSAPDLKDLPVLPPLKHPGRVHYIYPDVWNYNLVHVDGDLFSDHLLLDPKMIWHHFCFNYEKALRDARFDSGQMNTVCPWK